MPMRKIVLYVLCLLIAVSSLGMPFGTTARAADADFLHTGSTITKYIGPGGSVVIPGILDSTVITALGEYAFSNATTVTDVTIPDSITSIGYQAFEFCSALTNVTIGNGVTTIGNYAFWSCSALTTVTMGSSVNTIDYSAFYGCSSLTGITIPGTVTTIGNEAFYNCSSLASIVLPDSVTSLGNNAFYGCSGITSASIGAGITTISSYAFYHCSEMTSLTIGNNVTTIEDNAFKRCYKLTSVVIPDSVTSIGDEAFDSCTAMTSVTIGTGVTSIGFQAFSACWALTTVTIPKNVTSIGDEVFTGCDLLTSIIVDPENTAYSSSLNGDLLDKTATLFIACPNGKQGDYTIPNGIITIGSYAFEECTGLTSVVVPSSVTTIGDNAFEYCVGLTGMTIGSGVTSISSDAFSGCRALTSFTVDVGNTFYSSIDGVLFNKDATLLITYPSGRHGDYIIPSGVTDIGPDSFELCAYLTSVTLSTSVTNIGNFAFYRCSSLTQIAVDSNNLNYSTQDGVLFDKAKTTIVQYPPGKTGSYIIPNGVIDISSFAFRTCTELTSIVIPSGVTEIRSDSFTYCAKLTSITLPDTITDIEYWAFGYSGLTSVTIPEGVIYIGSNAFYGCEELTEVTIASTVTTVGGEAFAGCPNLLNAYFLGNAPTGKDTVFTSCMSGFKIHYLYTTTGWVPPSWYTFPIQPYCTITYFAETGGTISGLAFQNVDWGNNGSEVTAVPESGYLFVGWSDSSIVNPRTDTNVISNIALTAQFTLDTGGPFVLSAVIPDTSAPYTVPAAPHGSFYAGMIAGTSENIVSLAVGYSVSVPYGDSITITASIPVDQQNRYYVYAFFLNGVPAVPDSYADGGCKGLATLTTIIAEDVTIAPYFEIIGDLNLDGIVDIYDVNFLLSLWNVSESQTVIFENNHVSRDINRDGLVNLADASLLLGNYD